MRSCIKNFLYACYDWGYKQTTKDGETLSDWASSAEAVLLYDPKELPSFFSARWNTYTNPDLAFAVGRSCDPKPERRIIDIFPRSHHRPSIIKVPSLVQPIAGKPVKRWNFRKANWELFTAETERRTPGLPNPQADDADATYTAYCNIPICAAKKSIPRGFNKDYIPGWDNTCNHLLREHQHPPPWKTSTQLQQHYSRSWMKYVGPGGLRLWSLWTSHIQVARRGRP